MLVALLDAHSLAVVAVLPGSVHTTVDDHARVPFVAQHGVNGGRSPRAAAALPYYRLFGTLAVEKFLRLRLVAGVAVERLGNSHRAEARRVHTEDAAHHFGLIFLNAQFHPRAAPLPAVAVNVAAGGV